MGAYQCISHPEGHANGVVALSAADIQYDFILFFDGIFDGFVQWLLIAAKKFSNVATLCRLRKKIKTFEWTLVDHCSMVMNECILD